MSDANSALHSPANTQPSAAKIKERMIAGPACSAVAVPVMTKIPVPMMAPMPSVIRLVGPRTRRRLCSPVSWASSRIVFSGFVASRLAMQDPRLDMRRAESKKRLAILKQKPSAGAEGLWKDRDSLSRSQFAVLDSVREVEHQPDYQPHSQAKPIGPAKSVNHGAAHDNAQDRNQGQ